MSKKVLSNDSAIEILSNMQAYNSCLIYTYEKESIGQEFIPQLQEQNRALEAAIKALEVKEGAL